MNYLVFLVLKDSTLDMQPRSQSFVFLLAQFNAILITLTVTALLPLLQPITYQSHLTGPLANLSLHLMELLAELFTGYK